MLLPQEIELWYVLPALRRELSKELARLGLTQRDIARKLGITEAAVSQYLKAKRANKVSLVELEQEIKKAAKELFMGKHIIGIMVRLCGLVRERGLLCKVSKQLGFAKKNCTICKGVLK